MGAAGPGSVVPGACGASEAGLAARPAPGFVRDLGRAVLASSTAAVSSICPLPRMPRPPVFLTVRVLRTTALGPRSALTSFRASGMVAATYFLIRMDTV